MANDSRNYQARPIVGVVKPFKSLVASSSAQAGLTLALPHPIREFTVQIDKLVSSTQHVSTKATVTLQGKVSTGTTWFTLGSSFVVTTTAALLSRSTNAKAVTFVRLKLNTFTTKSGSAGPDVASVTGYIAPVIGV